MECAFGDHHRAWMQERRVIEAVVALGKSREPKASRGLDENRGALTR
jgi:hypothetical protein